MTTKPTAVVVRLPLSGEDCMTIRKHITSKCLTNDGIVNGIRAIGTPVAGGELDVAGWCHPQQLADFHIDNDNPDDERFVVMSRVKIGSRDIPLVRQSDAQAALAAAQAEIVRLAEENERLKHIAYSGKGTLTYTIHSPARFADEDRKALKGPAA